MVGGRGLVRDPRGAPILAPFRRCWRVEMVLLRALVGISFASCGNTNEETHFDSKQHACCQLSPLLNMKKGILSTIGTRSRYSLSVC